jgi:sec-independent protein translocase protein TatA
MGALTNPIHLAFIAMVALIFLGPKRLPELAKSLGTGMREFRETLSAQTHEAPEPTITAIEAVPPAPAPVPEVAPPVAPVAPPAVTPPHAPDAA